ncbi:MAG: hypothetical protein MJ131_07765 [Lachnospiraceae bacterium]|nr:hypothetical protein [Lachnospiraceae bacterium]
MYVLKIDLPTGIAYFTGKKKVVQGCESPGLTGDINGARYFIDEEEATKFCKMLVKKYDMEFYFSLNDGDSSKNESRAARSEREEEEFMSGLDKEIIASVMESEDDFGNRRNS